MSTSGSNLKRKQHPERVKHAPIAITPGEPAGIGPDLIIQLAQSHATDDWVIIADPTLLARRAAILGLPLKIQVVDREPAPSRTGMLRVMPVPLHQIESPGHLDPTNAAYVLETLKRAISGCQSGDFSALVTGPVHKGVINEAGIPFSGHTEFLSEQCGGAHPVMLLTTGCLRVALATTHLPLAAVSQTLTRERLSRVLRILDHDLRTRFGLKQPRILVCGLNPHAGESGHLGREEIEVIAPVLEQLRMDGLDIMGPLPADTVFTPRYLDHADAVLAMYHDQGLPVLKYAGFGQAVNITLGLPIIRTSVDHGTALSLAGSGQTLTSSLSAAIALASQLVTSAASV